MLREPSNYSQIAKNKIATINEMLMEGCFYIFSSFLKLKDSPNGSYVLKEVCVSILDAEIIYFTFSATSVVVINMM